MKEKVFLSSNGTGTAGIIKNDLLKNLFEKFSINFEDIVDIINSNHGSRFNERQSYGIFIKSIPSNPSDSNKDFVLTEVSLDREGNDSSKKGRVDFFIFYRNWLLLVELKLVRTGITTKDGSDYKIIVKKWEEAKKQIESIPVDNNPVLNEFVDRLKAKGIVKIPMMIIVYHENDDKNGNYFSDNDANEYLTDKVNDLESKIKPQYGYFTSINNKHSLNLGNDRFRRIRGISFFANS
ncbi:MAG: hypothetical protein WCK96_18050 [Methylococcales bacterium]